MNTSQMSPDVIAWLNDYDNPQKALLLQVREAVLSADPKLSECIKWKTPTFTYKGNIASFNPRSKKHVSLMFHTGMTIPGEFPNLHGSGDTAGYYTFIDAADLDRQRRELRSIVKAWIRMKDAA